MKGEPVRSAGVRAVRVAGVDMPAGTALGTAHSCEVKWTAKVKNGALRKVDRGPDQAQHGASSPVRNNLSIRCRFDIDGFVDI